MVSGPGRAPGQVGARDWSAIDSTSGIDRADPAHSVGVTRSPVHADLLERAAAVRGSAQRAVELAAELGPLPLPGGGNTAARWAMLTALSAADLTAGRVVEAHVDALAILAEAGDLHHGPDWTALRVDQSSTWGVFAAEGPGVRVDASPAAGAWSVSGTKPWCSLADQLSHALITAHVGGDRQLFAIRLADPGVTTDPTAWISRGLAEVTSGPIDLNRVPALPVGDPGWYLSRAGFAWGGMGVAACWLGGVIGLARSVHAAGRRREPDQIGLAQLGAIDIAVHRAQSVLEAAAIAIDAGRGDGADGALLALRVRAVVADAAEETLTRTAHALGPAPLALDEDHARRVADLSIYVRQHHAERDQAATGRVVLGADALW